MLDEIKLSTRKKSEDYIWFSPDRIDEEWRNKYKSAFFSQTKDVNFFVEINQNEYKVFFDKINSDRTDKEGRTIYSVVMSCGQRGSESSKAMFKLFKHYFLRGGEMVRQLFNREFSEDFIESVYDDAQTAEVEAQMKEKLSVIVSELEDIKFQPNDILRDNSYIFADFETGKDGLITLLELITNSKGIEGVVSLLLTSKPITKDRLLSFDHTIFSRGLCLTTSTVEGGRIEMTIKTVVSIEIASPPTKTTYTQGERFVADGCVIRITYSNGTTETKNVTDDEISGFDTQKVGAQKITVTYEGCTTSFEVTVNAPFDTVGTTTIQNAPKGNNTKNPETEENDSPLSTILSRIKSDQSFRKLLIITSVIILALLFMVRSCVKKSGNGSEKNSPEQKEQPSSPQSPDSSKKSTTDTLKIKVDSCKEFTKVSLGIKADSCKKSTKDTLK